MATILYGANPTEQIDNILVTSPGPAVTSRPVELNVDLATTVVKDNGGTRTINKLEVLLILELFEYYITKSDWPPA